MWITSLGKIWTGVTVKNEQMLTAAENFVREYRWKGPFELECIVDGDTVYLIEINPRFPAWSYFSTGVGINLPANTVRKAFNLPLTVARDYEAGKLFIRYTYEIITDMQPFQNIVTKGEN
jgi:carbamoyl-phosphate synthase large subunit